MACSNGFTSGRQDARTLTVSILLLMLENVPILMLGSTITYALRMTESIGSEWEPAIPVVN